MIPPAIAPMLGPADVFDDDATAVVEATATHAGDAHASHVVNINVHC